MAVESADVRRFLWVAMAEAVRLSRNTRLSTVKLHIKPLGERVPSSAIDTFSVRPEEMCRFSRRKRLP